MTQAQIIKIIDIKIDMFRRLIEENTDFKEYRYNLNQKWDFAITVLEQLKSSIK